jgi:hypothetical protein
MKANFPPGLSLAEAARNSARRLQSSFALATSFPTGCPYSDVRVQFRTQAQFPFHHFLLDFKPFIF